jgi:hypothetical protein
MDTTAVVSLVLGGVAVIALLVVMGVVGGARRRERERARLAGIRRWAAQVHWAVATSTTARWQARLPSEPGQPHGVTLMVSGVVDGWPVSVAEYFYVTESMADSDGSRSTTTHHLIVTATQLATDYPPIAVGPRRALSRLGRAMFGADATATGHRDFDRQFRVHTKNPTLVRALLGPALITEHLAGRVPPWDLAGHDLLISQRGRIEDPRQVPGLVMPLLRVADLLGR